MMVGKSSATRYLFPLFVGFTYLFLYVPIIILVVFSFNNSNFPYVWQGFTLRWYAELWASTEVWDALKNSLIVASCAATLSITMGVVTVVYGAHTILARLMVLFYGILAIPEIVLSVGFLSFYSFFGVPFGLTTIIAAHTLVGLGYVVPMVHARYQELDYALTEASMDLGATQGQTLWRIIVPLLLPSLFAAGLMVFMVSFDDFVISFFCSGAATQTLPIYIFSMIRSGTTPVVNALSTVLLVVSSLLVIIFSWLQAEDELP